MVQKQYTSSNTPLISQVDRITMGIDRGNFDGLLEGLAVSWSRRHQELSGHNRRRDIIYNNV